MKSGLGRFAARIAATALVALAAWEIGTLWHAASSVASDEDWAAAARAVRDEFGDGDLVTFAPAWIDPVGRYWLGDLISLPDVGRMDDARYARIWEVALRGARSPARAGEPPAWEARFGAVTVRRFERSAAIVSWDLRSVARLHEIDFEPRHCVPLYATDARRPKVLTVPRAELGDELHVRVGLVGVASRKRNRAVGRLEVEVDGAVVTSGLVDAERGWWALPVARTHAGLHTVSFRVSADHVREPIDLRVCVAAESRKTS